MAQTCIHGVRPDGMMCPACGEEAVEHLLKSLEVSPESETEDLLSEHSYTSCDDTNLNNRGYCKRCDELTFAAFDRLKETRSTDFLFATTACEVTREHLIAARGILNELRDHIGEHIQDLDHHLTKELLGAFPIAWASYEMEKLLHAYNEIARANGAALVRGTKAI